MGCAFGRKQDNLQAHPALEYTNKARLAVGVQDRRSISFSTTTKTKISWAYKEAVTETLST